MDRRALDALLDKEAIRELVLLYSRGVDRKDIELLKTLYAKDATDDHGAHFKGRADAYIDFLARSLPGMLAGGHFVCNHLIAVDGATAEGEVYALAYHIYPDGKGVTLQDVAGVRYVDRYAKENGRWLFASRIVTFDFREIKPVGAPAGPAPVPAGDPSYTSLVSRIFARGPRA
ncbi:MAG: nuclear transport factor 2 family protein [Steroidobacteraceae bacterium]